MTQYADPASGQDALYCSPVNNTGIDPLQGFDFEVWVLDVCTGKIAWFGSFQSLTVSIRDATETYLELGQRIPIHLNGEIQVAWVLEQGMVDMAFVYRTFGVKSLRRDQFITRGPRFQISFDANAYEIDNQVNNLNPPDGKMDRQGAEAYRWGTEEYSVFSPDSYYGGQKATAKGRYDIMRAKVDSVSLGIMPGRRVAALRWEGVAEGITYVNETVQQFKVRSTSRGDTGYGNFVNSDFVRSGDLSVGVGSGVGMGSATVR
jgi:hypothetical protein